MAVRFHPEWICLEYHLSDGIWETLYKTKRFKNGMSLGFCIIGTGRLGTMGLHFTFLEELQVSLRNKHLEGTS